MRKMTILLTGVLLIAIGIPSSARAQTVRSEEAFNVAQNWTALIIAKEGSWGGAETAEVYEVREFTRDGLLLGYFCPVQPQGYVLVSLRKELAPVQAYSDTGDVDPESNEGMMGISKEEMERILREIDMPAEPGISIQGQVPEDDPRLDWEKLGQDPETFPINLESGLTIMDYEGGDPPLLTSSWHQEDPYNQRCPVGCCMPCPVGCTPLAGAQIMRYWAWPPEYDWPNMPDELSDDSAQVQIDAVARLCADVGEKAGADYCIANKCETFCFLADNKFGKDLLDALEDHFGYSDDADEEVRITESATEWFNYFKEQLNLNRPVPYELGTGFHTVVCDGWKQVGGTRYLHLNYGWGGKDTQWWPLDKQPKRGPGEHTIIRLYPWCAEGAWLDGQGFVGIPGVHVYFDQDSIPSPLLPGSDPIRYAGSDCQFLPGVRVRTTVIGDWVSKDIEFFAVPLPSVRLFSIKGTLAASIKINGKGTLRLSHGGQVRFY